MMRSRRVLIWCSAPPLFCLLSVLSPRVADGQPRAPRLIVLLMIDQMRADYIDRYGHMWTGGLRRLLDEGAWFREADYPFANTVTCSGHASVSTGTLPAVHGMIQNSWYDRERGRVVNCADDFAVTALSYGKPVSAMGQSGFRLTAPTLADELRAQLSPTPRIVSLSLKARTAAMLGGQHPDAIAWISDHGAWGTSTAYPNGLSPAIEQYVAAHPVEHQFWSVWDRALPREAYQFEPRAVGVRGDPPAAAFPHVIRTWDDWQSSPLADEYLVRMALEVAAAMHLGNAGRTDMLALGFSTLDLVGHDYGPNSHEVQDVLVRLDRALDELLTGLDRLAGRDNYVVALSSDHGVAPTPERARTFGLDAQRLPGATIIAAAEQAIASILGPGRYVTRLVNSEIYLEDGTLETLSAHHGAVDKVRRAILAIDGIAAVYTRDDLTAQRSADDAIARQVANSFVPARSGDIVIVAKPYWLVNNGLTANHGTPYRYDTHVPVLLMGAGIAKGQYLDPVTPLDIAPTLAYLAGVTLPYAQGRLLAPALVPPRPAESTRTAIPSVRPPAPTTVRRPLPAKAGTPLPATLEAR